MTQPALWLILKDLELWEEEGLLITALSVSLIISVHTTSHPLPKALPLIAALPREQFC